ncbi:MAG: hypothetical protein AAF632_26630 [Bacteroidota bacterium]
MENWIFPLTLISGIGLFIISTATLSANLLSEIDHLLKEAVDNQLLLEKKMKQMGLLNRCLAGLYLSAACFALAGLVGGSELTSMQLAVTMSHGLLILGTLLLCLCLGALIVYALRAVQIKQQQFSEKINRIH